MSDNLENNIIDLGERMSRLDTGAMFPFTPLWLALRRVAASSSKSRRYDASRKRNRSETEARQKRFLAKLDK